VLFTTHLTLRHRRGRHEVIHSLRQADSTQPGSKRNTSVHTPRRMGLSSHTLRPARHWSLSWARCCWGIVESPWRSGRVRWKAMAGLLWATGSSMLKAEQRVLFQVLSGRRKAAILYLPNS